MARILNFSLTMKDGYKVKREIAELREYFDLETVLGLYKTGTLQRWLKRNGYAELAEQLDDLDEDAPDFMRAFCRILGVEAADHDAVDVAELSERTWRLRKLRDYTTDPYLLDMAENAAFSQSDLDELIDEGAEEIVLCDGRFTIPLKARGTKYYGVGKAIAVIESDEIVDFERKYIMFQNVKFDERYQSLCERSGTVVPRKRAEEGAADGHGGARTLSHGGAGRLAGGQRRRLSHARDGRARDGDSPAGGRDDGRLDTGSNQRLCA